MDFKYGFPELILVLMMIYYSHSNKILIVIKFGNNWYLCIKYSLAKLCVFKKLLQFKLKRKTRVLKFIHQII